MALFRRTNGRVSGPRLAVLELAVKTRCAIRRSCCTSPGDETKTVIFGRLIRRGPRELRGQGLVIRGQIHFASGFLATQEGASGEW